MRRCSPSISKSGSGTQRQAAYNNHLFRYLNRHWVKREMDEGKKDIYDIYTLHLVRWKEDMFGTTQNAVMGAVLRLD